MLYDGKTVLSQDGFTYATAQIGDYVEQAVVDDAMDCLPPVHMGPNCSQMGEPCSQCKDPRTGKWRMTYHTFKKVGGNWPNGIWQYCGRCFCGETAEPGEPISYGSEGGSDDRYTPHYL